MPIVNVADMSHLAMWWTGAVWRASLQGGVFLLVVWIAVRLLPRLTPSVRCWLWRLATLKLVLSLFWSTPIDLPLLPAKPPVVNASVHQATQKSVGMQGTTPAPLKPSIPGNRPEGQIAYVPTLLFVVWLGGVIVLALRAVHEYQRAGRLRGGSVPILDIGVRNIYRQLYRQFAIPDPPILLQYEGDGSPLLLGLRNPAILIPAGLIQSGTEDEIRMLLAHELAHYRRGDLLWCWIPALAHFLFYFHPAVWLANREWPLDQEMACDLVAVDMTDAPVGDYGEMLVKIAIQRPSVPHPGLASIRGDESLETLKRRLDAMNEFTGRASPALRTVGAVLATISAISLVPWRVVAQTPRAAVPQVAVPQSNNQTPNTMKNQAPAKVPAQPISQNAELSGNGISPSRSIELAGQLADLNNPDQFKRSAAVNALAESFPEAYPGEKGRVVQALSLALNDENLFIRQAAVRALAVWGGRSTLPYILTALNDKEHSVRWATLDILTKLRDPRSADAIAARLSSGDGFKASPALVAIGPAAERSVLGCLNDHEWSVRLEACKILKQIGTRASLPMLQRAAVDQNGIVVMAANDAITEISKR